MSIETLKMRLEYGGGQPQQDRMIKDKLRSLKKALLYSYQGGTAVLKDGRRFRCLMNPDKLRNEYEDKIISIPFKDVCLDDKPGEKTSRGEQEIGLKVGDTFEWEENKTFWLVYLQYEEEYAYFRARCRKCDYEITIAGNKYRAYLKGPNENSILWHTKQNTSWNDTNYKPELYIENNEDTKEFFHRFKKIKIDGKPWEIQVVDSMSNTGILVVQLKEEFSNSTAETLANDKDYIELLKIKNYVPLNEVEEEEKKETEVPYIDGPAIVYPYDTIKYTIKNKVIDEDWKISDSKKVKILDSNAESVLLEIVTSKTGNFNLSYGLTSLSIKINSL